MGKELRVPQSGATMAKAGGLLESRRGCVDLVALLISILNPKVVQHSPYDWRPMALKQDKVRIFIADDHPVFRFGLRQIIEAEPDFDVVGEADHGEDALELIGTLRPSIAILDVAMPR